MSTQPQLQHQLITPYPRMWHCWWLALLASCGLWLISPPTMAATAASSCTGNGSTQSAAVCRAALDWSVFNPGAAAADQSQKLVPAREIMTFIAGDGLNRFIPFGNLDQDNRQQRPSSANRAHDLTRELAKVSLQESSPLVLMLLGLAGLILARRRVQQQGDRH